MRQIFVITCALLLGCASADDDDTQELQQSYVKSVKGGDYGGRYRYQAGENFARFFGNNTQYNQHGYNYNQQGYMRHNLTATVDYEIGVCYMEVPTASLVKDPSHIPAGNGSRPDLSRIRTCCKGYIRNIHNYKICDPVCSKECVNALCSAPETCTCFPDHVKNLAGYCVATCPIGCQHGTCAGGECLCHDGYKLDSDSKFCMPSCKENCGGFGNCTAPNKCECRTGYTSTPEGSCKPVCNHCVNGDCIAPNECRCHHGYAKDQRGECAPHCPQGCGPNGRCVSPNVCNYPTTTTTTPATVTFYPVNPDPLQSGSHLSYQPNQPSNYYPNQPSNYPHNQPNQLNYPHNQPNQTYNYYPGQPNPNQPNQPYPSPSPSYYPNQPNPHQPNQPYSSPSPNYYPNQPNPNQPNQPQPNQPSGYPYSSANYQPNQPQNPTNPANPSYNSPNQPSKPLYPDQQVDQTHEEFPVCSEICINAYCVEGNRCVCNPGYVQDRSDPTGSKCVPHCPGGCVNGVCSAPNFCICNMGYYKDHSVKGRATCVKRAKRSANEEKPVNVAELLVFEIPDY